MGMDVAEEMFYRQDQIDDRVKTGLEGLDSLVQGGFPKRSINLVSGPPGSGKSIFCFQFLYEGLKNNEKGLYLTLDKKVDGIINQAKKIGFDFTSAIENKLVKFQYLNINKKMIYENMTNEILSGSYSRVILDSISPLAEMPIFIKNTDNIPDISIINSASGESSKSELPIRRLHLRYIFDALETSETTSIVTSELPLGSTILSRDGISEFLADSVILLNFDPTMDRRKISVMKMRNTKHTLKPQEIEIGIGGLRIL